MYQLSVPSKTFLVGEYVALEGGPALILNTEPRFQLFVTERLAGSFPSRGINLRETLNPQVQQILRDDFYQGYEFYFSDPFEGRGGLGASSAMLSLLLGFRDYKMTGSYDGFKILNQCTALPGFKGSGYDVLAQLTGGITSIEKKNQVCQEIKWPWLDLEVVLVRGPQKTLTHEHLSVVGRSFPELTEHASDAVSAFKMGRLDQFLMAINRFTETQKKLGLLSHQVNAHLEAFKNDSVIRAARGCGAMGSDILLLIVSRNRDPSWDIKLKKTYESLPTLLSRGFRLTQSPLASDKGLDL